MPNSQEKILKFVKIKDKCPDSMSRYKLHPWKNTDLQFWKTPCYTGLNNNKVTKVNDGQ